MSTVQWVDKTQTLLLVEITVDDPDKATETDEQLGAILHALDRMRVVSHPVDFVVDLRHTQHIMTGNWLSDLRFISARTPCNVRHVVIIGLKARSLLQRTLALIDRIQTLPTDSIHLVNTGAEAVTFLTQQGYHLPDLQDVFLTDDQIHS